MDHLRDTYGDEDEDEDEFVIALATPITTPIAAMTSANTCCVNDGQPQLLRATTETTAVLVDSVNEIKEEAGPSSDVSEDEDLDDVEQNNRTVSVLNEEFSKSSNDCEENEEEGQPLKKQKPLSPFTVEGAVADRSSEEPPLEQENVSSHMTSATASRTAPTGKKTKKKSKSSNVWSKSNSRRGKKKNKTVNNNVPIEDTVLIAPVPRIHDKNDDLPDMKIRLSKVYKAEKVELSEDRLSAGSTKGYRMVRATRGVTEGAWYFEIKIATLGETGHTRLGWSTDKGELQAPVGYDGNSYGYRDIDGCKIHKALREKYGMTGYGEGDVLGFYINLPEGNLYAPKPPQFVWYKGQKYVCVLDPKEDPPKVIPGSAILFFKNGVCQGVAFEDLFGGRYFPAASMYTLPNQPKCTVNFNFGPDFEFFPDEFDGRPIPKPMSEVPYHGPDGRVEDGRTWDSSHIRFSSMVKSSMLKSEDVAVSES